MKLFLRFFGADYSAPTSERWNHLAESLKGAGFELVDYSQIDTADAGLWVDYDKSVDELQVPKNNKILFACEPRSVHPMQYSMRTVRKFGTVFSENRDQLLTESKFAFWASGQFSSEDLDALSKESKTHQRNIRVGIINGNKNSHIRGNLYGLRREVIRALSLQSSEFCFAGRGWNRGWTSNLLRDIKEFVIAVTSGLPLRFVRPSFGFNKFRWSQYIGEVSNAREFLSNVEVAIVIENEQNYYSEKLTDALYARCHVIYVGPTLPGIEVMRNVTVCKANSADILGKVDALRRSNYSGITYTPGELDFMKTLSFERANEDFCQKLKKILRVE